MKDWKSACAWVSCILLLVIIGFQLWKGVFVLQTEQANKVTSQLIELSETHIRKREEMNFISKVSTVEQMIVSGSSLSDDVSKITISQLTTHAHSLAPFNTAEELNNKLALIECVQRLIVESAETSSCVIDYTKKVNIKV
ncbi:hypothetical protein ACEV8A_24665 [Vibrio parahaemolyticus]|uniref:hypothetical protein n=1 Tax=Vibrio harveyi group TaxID=717610 RepID=UPI000944C6A2|nr:MULTISPECIES: hypothetical protein [Vibrio harveyi group]ELA7191472.1 hypothetical protein [Vibrio alginolyticus]KAB2114769.1 hypothetical protein F6475_13035 [Vibrio alginolyticus]MDF4666920.1 hypothetical protein [Vibrio parahaemolyticus]OKY34827.1 hypothetical protein BT101_25430 [Vibrio parahaemolyticus]TOH11645.1 hypothetical protein CGI86_23575 [Vibrio parahaemolyticus]